MFKPSGRGASAGGWKGGKGGKSFGDKKPWARGGFGGRDGGRDGGKPMMHSATCGECGSSCEVPFRPNGRKPVLCHSCFKKEGGGSDSGSSFEKRRPSFGGDREKRSFSKPSYERSGGSGDSQYREQLSVINHKLDAILDALAARN